MNRDAWRSALAAYGLVAAACGATPSPDAEAEVRAPRLLRDDVELTADELRRVLRFSPLPPPPPSPTNAHADDPAAFRLGRALFFDERLSRDGDASCATCHLPELGWADGERQARLREELPRHTMSLWNVGQQRWFFWDGRADTLWSQALEPLENPDELATNRARLARLIAGTPDLRALYAAAFGPPPDLDDPARFPADARPAPDTDHPEARAWEAMHPDDRHTVNEVFANLGKALAAFERRIVSEPTPFDRFVQGLWEGDAALQASLSVEAARGMKLFAGRANCHLCHSGPAFSDLEFHDNRVGDTVANDGGRFTGIARLRANPFNALGAFSDDAEGEARLAIELLPTATPLDRWGEFKTPSLRNAALSPPYMHRGQLATLEDVVRHYVDVPPPDARHHGGERILRPLDLDERDVADLVAFLEALSAPGIPAELLPAD